MKPLTPDEEEMVRSMKDVRIAETSADLKRHVLHAARQAWDEATGDVAAIEWTSALAPLAASAFAVLVLVVGSGHVAHRTLAPWNQDRAPAPTVGRATDWRWGALDERPLLRRFATETGSVRTGDVPAAIEAYRSRVRELINDGRAAPGERHTGGMPAESQSGRDVTGELHAARHESREGEVA